MRNHLISTTKIALSGFTGPNRAMLEYCLTSAVDCELVSDALCDLVLVNGDQGAPDEEIQTLVAGKFSDQTKVVISIRELDWDGFTLLQKPHSSDELLELVRSFALATMDQSAPQREKPAEIASDNIDYFRSRHYTRERRGEALKQKLIKGKLVVNAADRLVQQIETDIKQQEQKLQDDLAEEKAKHQAALLAKKKALKLKALKQKQLEEKKKALAKKKAAAEKAKKLKAELKKRQQIKELEDKPTVVTPELTEEVLLQCCGNAADIDFSRLDEKRSVFLNPEGTLLVRMTEALELVRKTGKCVVISGLPGVMFIKGEAEAFTFSFNDDFLNQLALTRFGYGELEVQVVEEIPEVADEIFVEEVDLLIWKVALWTARGRLFTGMDPEKTMQLVTKPDFKKFQPLPSCEEINDVWSGHSASALDVARILDIPQRVVFAFMSGAFTLGWFQE